MLTGRKAELDRQLEQNEHEQTRLSYLIEHNKGIVKRGEQAAKRLPGYQQQLAEAQAEHKALLEQWNKEGEASAKAI